jgi:4-hydroxybenzoate polyprenyltransferase
MRKKIEVLSTPILLRINTWPRFIVPVLILSFLLIGLFIPGSVGGFFILIVGLFVGWLLYLSWPLLGSRARLIRLGVVALILFSAYVQITAA